MTIEEKEPEPEIVLKDRTKSSKSDTKPVTEANSLPDDISFLLSQEKIPPKIEFVYYSILPQKQTHQERDSPLNISSQDQNTSYSS